MTSRARERWAALSDVGRVRTHNEDAVLAHPPLFAVADGLGGHEAGEVASSIAVETLRDNAPRHADAAALARAVRAANREVIRAAREGIGREGMGTTLTAAIVEGTDIAVAQVGDSRAYLLRDGALSRITQDHSLVHDLVMSGEITADEAFSHPRRNVITRALGSDPNMVADAYAVDGAPGDRVLLCSDGLSGLVPEPDMADILQRFRDPAGAVRALIDAANQAGGTDNISAIVIDVDEDADAQSRSTRRLSLRILGTLLTVVAVLVLAGGVAFLRMRDRAFLEVEDGMVVIYRGVPGQIAGLSIRQRVSVTDVAVADLPLAERRKLERGITADSVDAANAIVDELEASRYAPDEPEETGADTTGPDSADEE